MGSELVGSAGAGTPVLVVEETVKAKKALAGMAIEGMVMVEMAAAAEMIAESQWPRILSRR